jgi:hypothetical protein
MTKEEPRKTWEASVRVKGLVAKTQAKDLQHLKDD